MKAIIYETFQGPIQVKNLPDPSPKLHGVVIKVDATGLCRSDWHGWKGTDPDVRINPVLKGLELVRVMKQLVSDMRLDAAFRRNPATRWISQLNTYRDKCEVSCTWSLPMLRKAESHALP